MLKPKKDFYEKKLGFEIGNITPQACVFKYNQGEAKGNYLLITL